MCQEAPPKNSVSIDSVGETKKPSLVSFIDRQETRGVVQFFREAATQRSRLPGEAATNLCSLLSEVLTSIIPFSITPDLAIPVVKPLPGIGL